MNIETLRTYCLNKLGATESFPFGNDTLVFKVANKVFLLTSLENPNSFNAKCNPEKAVLLREKYPEIVPGYHMNKKHWNTVYYDGSLSEKLLKELVDDSYQLVYEGLPKSLKQEIENL
ncbi:MmcQ/YjbR family DNA-binding protein [Pedobacter sp. SD-b]|uniref:MmcQ/YjbR family DNA-binding protein n=1 Tax=Pedobacter segetis TaxID=2793069 RepID=A0ABS1BLS1_9SPHI|nr:MmcQ/YjbR family DNA-binding protein [Pedobacter segetis]MBK0383753.1 MmcQ/YjbR family DNA-binding protein [Pedobacter segetis]